MVYRPYGDQIAMRNAVIRAGSFSNLSHLGAKAAIGIGKRLGQAYNKYRKGSSGSVSNQSASSPTTFQNDRIRSYRKRRGPSRRKLRRIRRFDRAVTNVVSRNLGQKFLLTNPYFGVGTAMSGEQAMLDFSMAAATNNPTADLNNVISLFNTGSATYDPSPNLLKLDNMTMEVRMRNVSGGGVGVSMDLYYFRTRKSLPAVESACYAKLISAFTETPPFAGGGTPFVYTTLGITPFNASQWCEHFLITKVVKVELADGQETTFKLVNRRPMRIHNESINDFACIKGVTQGVLVIYRATLSAVGGGQDCSIAWSSIRSYRGQHMQSSATQGAVI